LKWALPKQKFLLKLAVSWRLFSIYLNNIH
jgi:hypothetical protein